MAGETIITIIGNLTADPELRFTNSGVPVASFTVASTPSYFDKQAGEFKDGDPLFMRCSVWREQAENVSESLAKGSRVVVSGRLKPVEWQDKKTGEKRTGIELVADEVAASLKYHTAQLTKRARGQGAPHPAERDQAFSAGYDQARSGEEPPPF